jgi:hypothetical protein
MTGAAPLAEDAASALDRRGIEGPQTLDAVVGGAAGRTGRLLCRERDESRRQAEADRRQRRPTV